jgi:hypothetical protein
VYEIFRKIFDRVSNGEESVEDVTDEIEGSNLPSAVKHYLIDQMPLAPEKKDGYFSRIWKAITNE